MTEGVRFTLFALARPTVLFGVVPPQKQRDGRLPSLGIVDSLLGQSLLSFFSLRKKSHRRQRWAELI